MVSLLLLAIGMKQAHTFGFDDKGFLMDGRPFTIMSGEMHYPRIPRPYWRDRLKKAKAMGLNTVCTYVFWNAHEAKRERFDFSGNLDIKTFCRTAQEEGLYVIVRPGPYVCTEWDFGGLPAWLLKNPKTVVRSQDPVYLEAAKRYLNRIGQELAPLMLKKGGPIIMAQVENEYGSYGSDHTYMGWVRDTMKDSGFDCQLYTSDGSLDYMLKGGTLPDLPSVINFGGDAEKEFQNFAKFRQNVPRMVGEYWCGWFDHWGKDHATTSAAEHAKELDWMLSNGISFNLYMFHGGTNFAFTAGANGGKNDYNADTTSYDYDAPLDEAGRPTAKYLAFQEVIRKHNKSALLPVLPPTQPLITIGRFPLEPIGSMFDVLPRPIPSAKPLNFEAFDQAYGWALYETTVSGPIEGMLDLSDLRDYALVYLDNRLVGRIDRRENKSSCPIRVSGGSHKLRILVENLGRVNFGREFGLERKGFSSASMAGTELAGWTIYPMPFERVPKPKMGDVTLNTPTYFTGTFDLKSTGDTFLDMRGWSKGVVWVNGYNLGRFWKIGAQQSLYLPGCWLKKGTNEIVALELDPDGARSVRGVTNQIFERPKSP